MTKRVFTIPVGTMTEKKALKMLRSFQKGYLDDFLRQQTLEDRQKKIEKIKTKLDEQVR